MPIFTLYVPVFTIYPLPFLPPLTGAAVKGDPRADNGKGAQGGDPLWSADQEGCGHKCLLLCHPGPCPPCPRIVDASCYCA